MNIVNVINQNQILNIFFCVQTRKGQNQMCNYERKQKNFFLYVINDDNVKKHETKNENCK